MKKIAGIAQKLQVEILMNLHVLDLPEYIYNLSMNTITQKRTKLEWWNLGYATNAEFVYFYAILD